MGFFKIKYLEHCNCSFEKSMTWIFNKYATFLIILKYLNIFINFSWSNANLFSYNNLFLNIKIFNNYF